MSRLDRSRRSREGNEHGIALGVNFDAAETGADPANEAAMFSERLRVSVCPKLVEQPRRAFYVAE